MVGRDIGGNQLRQNMKAAEMFQRLHIEGKPMLCQHFTALFEQNAELCLLGFR